jgi:F0F1-type ATP synthase membrane subunit a
MIILLVVFYLFELFVAVIQAYVFAMLTVQYINLSIHVDH